MRENHTIGIVFSNIHDQQLGALTEKRTTASIPFGGRYRFIDFTLSNLVNAGITDVGIITKSNYQSLVDHVGNGKEWDLDRKRGGLTLLAPYSNQNSGIYRGRMEALAGALSYLRHSKAEYVVLTDSDLIANFDLKSYIEAHIASGADMTMLYKTLTTPEDSCKDTAILTLDETGRLTDVAMAEQTQKSGKLYLDVSILRRDLLEQKVGEIWRHGGYSFIRDFLWPNLSTMNIRGVEYQGVAMRIGNLQAYYKANMRLLEKEVQRELFWQGRPVYTKVRDEVPVKYGLQARAGNCLVADGCIIDGEVENSVIFRGVRIGKGAKVKNSILMQGTEVGENATLDYVITDKNVRIKDGRSLMGFVTYPAYFPKGGIV